jgi:MFS family permease
LRFVRDPRSVFYGWWLVGAGMTIQIMVGGLMLQAFGAYAAVLKEEFGWGTLMFSIGFAMTRVESGALGPLQGWAIDKYGAGGVARIGLAVMGAGFVLFSQIQEPWQFFVTYFLIAVGASLAGFMTLTVAIVNWFDRHRSLALGVMSSGFAVGGFLVILVVQSFEAFGWRWTSFGSGIIILVIGQILVTFVRHRPEDYGETPDGLPVRVETNQSGEVVTIDRDFTAREALHTRSFWFISLGHASALLVVSAVMVHLVLHLTENLGYSLTVAGLVIGFLTAMQVVGQLLGGFLGDRFNKRAILVVTMLGHAAGLLFLAFATAFWMLIAFGVLHGVAWGARGPLTQSLRAQYFGRKSFGTIMGFSSMIIMLGMTTGPIVAGVLRDWTGSYELGFTVLAVLAAMGSVFFVFSTPPQKQARVEEIEHQMAEREPALSAGG